MYLSKPLILVTLFKYTAKLNPCVVKHLNGMPRKLLNLNNISVSKSSLQLLTTDSSKALESAEMTKEIELTPIPLELQELAKNDPEVENKIRVILMEHEMHKLTDRRIPSALTADNMQELLEKGGYMARKKYLNFLFLKEILPEIDKQKKEKRRLERLQKKEELMEQEKENGHISYGLNNNTIFLYIRDKTMNRFHNYRQGSALLFGQPLVFDLGFQENMNKRETLNMVEQLALSYHENKIHNDPYNIYFTNVDFESPLYNQLMLTMPQLQTEDNNMITVSKESYLDIFPKEKLVYLSPDAKQTIDKYDHDAIYIIGGIVDKSEEIPLTMAKAKREGIRMAKLPLNTHLMWGSSGRKCLTLNQTIKIMLEVKYTRDWKKALTAVPTRKLKKVEDVQELAVQKRERMRKRVEQLERREKTKLNPEFWKKMF